MTVIFWWRPFFRIALDSHQESSHSLLWAQASLLAVLSLLGFLLPATSRADSVTAESIWSESNAQQRARSQVPQGAEILGVNCSSVDVRNDLRYRCTVEFNPAQ
jgi:hypothetical protein